MENNVLLYLGIILFCGLLFGRLAKLCKLPNVTGYLVGGLLIGPSFLNLIPSGTLQNFDIISDVALGFIAFAVGSEFKFSYLKKVGVGPLIIAVCEAFGAILLVFGGLLLAGFPMDFSIVLASIAAATAPAATIMVVRQYKAKGPVTDTLLTVVALDDAVALMGFGIAVAIAQAMNGASTSIMMTILDPLIEIVGALGIGVVLGFLFLLPMRFFKKDGNRLIIVCGFIFLGVAIADWLGLSSLLLIMAMGATLINVAKGNNTIPKVADFVTPPIFLMFFVISGAELDISVLPTIGLVGVIYVVLRVAGKCGGAALGSVIAKSPPAVKKYLGPTLLPQAGVAIGLSLLATQMFPDYGGQIRAVILCGTFIYELIGPAITKLSLKAAGEIKAQPSKHKHKSPPAELPVQK
ncbi:cation:proton antiporter [Candidatus Soleaferrea massiliensis]|uniref:cation:proton antiporter n=1 Tax=Candidatus Soleaferrea massiliensis TaxID=1470354 RepID=UPI000693CE0B|nr:cation:proton antiporter [Candidatus Soleaferrea massiliensis]